MGEFLDNYYELDEEERAFMDEVIDFFAKKLGEDLDMEPDLARLALIDLLDKGLLEIQADNDDNLFLVVTGGQPHNDTFFNFGDNDELD